MNVTTISDLLDSLKDDGIIDGRATPDTNRRGQFLAGWHDHTARRRVYIDRTLQTLTWHNPGWRLARQHQHSASLDNDEIRDIFDDAESLWYQRRT